VGYVLRPSLSVGGGDEWSLNNAPVLTVGEDE